MRTKQLFLILTLLCTVVQGAWAQNFDVWDGVTTKKPSGYYDDPEDDWYITINSAAELAFVMQNYKPDPTYEFYNLPWPPFVLGSVVSRASCEVNFILNADVDMTAGTWIPIGTNWEEKRFYKRFYGNGHTVRLKIDGATDNYQGMFAVVNGLVTNLRVDGRISCGNARLVGGICGYNTGTIENCWVSANVESNHWNVYHYADLGGVCGWNDGTVKYCCMTGNVKNTAKNAGVGGIVGSNYGTVQHCTFYGDVSVDYTQNNKYVGYQTKTMENCFDVFNQGEYDADGNMSLYRRAIKYPYALKLTSAGSSTYVVSAGGEEGASATRSGETVTLTKSGTFDMVRVEIKDADGNDISTTGDINGTLTFTMPKRDVYIAAYSWSDWPTQGSGTSDDPYIISNAEEWKLFANNVSLGRDYSGQYIKLTNDISVSAMAGGSETNAFKGTFDGDGHTLTFNATGQTEKFVAPFRCVGGTATIKNLKTAGRISSNNMYATGLVASIENVGGHVSDSYWPSVTIENCQSSMAINNSGSGDLTISGLVGRIENATLTIRGCVFDGSMSGSSATGNAGFVSWIAPYGKVTFEDCLFAPSSLSTSTDLCATFARMDNNENAVVTIARCYLTQALGEQQGILCICTNSAPSQLGSLVHDYGKLQAYENGLYYNGKYYLSPATSTNEGTESDPYIIAHEADWESFVLWIKEKGDSFTGEYVQLATDITVSTMVGTSEIPFSGIFLGNGHTITANISDTSNDGTALFRNIKGATIKDLTVAGTITGGLHAAAIVGIARGTGNSIRNCVATANVSGGTHIGGILGHATNSDIAISGCVFSGTMTGGADAKGAIVGWGDNGGTKSVTDCLYLVANGQNTANLDLVRQYQGAVTVTNSYKTTSAGTYGTHCFSFTFPPAPLGNPRQDYGGLTAYEDAIFYDGTYYLAPATLSGSGTETAPYLICNTFEWDSFVRYVNSGTTYSGQYVKLAEDISVSTMVGTSEANSFQGTFLGGGYTLTFTQGSSSAAFGEENCAPFRYVKNATIQNLRLMGDIYTSRKFAGGLVACCIGTTNITGCQVGTLIYSSVSGDGTHGGIVAMPQSGSTLNIEGCVYNGHLLTNSETNSCGGFVGWHNGATISVSNSFFAPGSSIPTGWTAINVHTTFTFVRGGNPTITNCYFTRALGAEQGTQCFPFTVEPTALGELVKEYSVLKVYQSGVFYAGTYYMVPATLAGSGTASEPYLIRSTYEWDSFARYVNEGNSYSGQYVQLLEDISVSTMVGVSESNPFSGTFLGDRHTITANISDASNGGTALFSYINGATIKDLTVGGTISGGIHAAAIVGIAKGTGNVIQDCAVTANVSGGTYIGGILGHGTNSDIAISGCVFSGKMTGGAKAKGAIFGWGNNGGTKSVTDCLYLMANGQNTDGLDLVRQYEGTVSVTNCYKTTGAGTYGTHCICTNDTPFDLGTLKQDYGMVKAYTNGILCDGTYYMAPATLKGIGAMSDPYLISSTYEWDIFAYYVNNGTPYSGQYVKLAEDISVSTMVGTSEANSFQGTFLGGGHTLTFTKGTAESAFGEENCAPFRYVKNASIQNLKVMGEIYTSRKFAGGLVACCIGATNIIGCQVGTLIYSSVSGDGTHGGIVAMPQSGSTLNIEGCVYDGHLLTNSGTNSCGGFVGWHNGATISVSNSLYAPASSIPTGWTPITGGTTFVRGGNPTITGCCYTETMGGAQGTQCFPAAVEPTALGELVKEYSVLKVYQSGVFYAGTYYMAPASISLADNGDNSITISEAHGYLADVTLQGRTLYKDGDWNTLCLPFSLDNFTGTPLEGATVKTLASTSFSGGTLTMNFTDDVNSIEAGKPYIVKWAKPDGYTVDGGYDISEPMFSGVTISNATANAETDYVDFIGTYSPISIYTAEKTNLYLGADNTLYYPTDENFTVNACRGYFQLKQGLTASPNPSQGGGNQVRAFVLNFGDDEPTAIKEMVNGKSSNGKSAWYTLDGRKLSGKPSRARIYINNGKKIVIK